MGNYFWKRKKMSVENDEYENESTMQGTFSRSVRRLFSSGGNSKTFCPVLHLANNGNKLLWIPETTVPCERVFGSAANIVSKRRRPHVFGIRDGINGSRWYLNVW